MKNSKLVNLGPRNAAARKTVEAIHDWQALSESRLLLLAPAQLKTIPAGIKKDGPGRRTELVGLNELRIPAGIVYSLAQKRTARDVG